MSFTPETPAAGPLPHSTPTYPALRQSNVLPVPPSDVPNVLIFGETGTGKSALINMLADQEVAQSSSEASGCTFESTAYQIVLDGKAYCIWDSAGLNEAEGGNVDPALAVNQLAKLADDLNGRLNLLVYCMRGTRFRKVIKDNYDLFRTIVTGGNVPIVLVITGLEQEDDMEDWWKENEADLRREGIRVQGHACVTTTLGKIRDGVGIYQSEYDLSRGLVKKLVKDHCLEQAYVLQRAPNAQHLVQARSYESSRYDDRNITVNINPSSSPRLGTVVVDFLAQAFTFLLDLVTPDNGHQLVPSLRPAGSSSTRRHDSSRQHGWQSQGQVSGTHHTSNSTMRTSGSGFQVAYHRG
ncbi:hypothetical protein BDN72DRAFT_98755 [Pluteus cervinus]|uniref:Uncharacterized protein n=1 Tax=Pluteus cervinus TaxID=181527 RepID=A0ACD3AQ12_9AGAR|nr:hypothetical protein BDN72DRAFT_98755 [Pluteus cervinus]